jgi:hypothetical protein
MKFPVIFLQPVMVHVALISPSLLAVSSAVILSADEVISDH